jgi:hypothetical protein
MVDLCCVVSVTNNQISREFIFIPQQSVVWVHEDYRSTKVWKRHFQEGFRGTIRLIHVQSVKFVRQGRKTLLVEPGGPDICSFTPVLDHP